MVIKIQFEQKSKKEILIFGVDERGQRKEIGHIITPAGSGETFVNAIQICGFDWAYDFWGCGVYGDKATGKMKKDIQLLWFNNYDKMSQEEIRKIKVGEKKHPITKHIYIIKFWFSPIKLFTLPITSALKNGSFAICSAPNHVPVIVPQNIVAELSRYIRKKGWV